MATRRRTAAHRDAVSLDLALQGGGSHGAFTWGVLDRLLDERGIRLDGISGTSAGALNAGVLATGLAAGGPAGAQAALRAFWHDVAGVRGCFGETSADPWAAVFGPSPWAAALPLRAFNLDRNPFYHWFQQLSRSLSPYQFNPLGPNALGTVARRHVDEAALRSGTVKLFVVATAVHTGQPRIFSGDALSIDALLASACLPQMFKAVVIDDQPYWDGGYSGNPALWPLIYETAADDLLLVKINPLQRQGTPDTASEIADRVNEITFNAGLVAEMRAIHFVQRMLAEDRLDPAHYRSLRMHMVADDEGLAPLKASSKLNTELVFLQRLHDLGAAAADRWLAAHGSDLGRRGTLDIEASFLSPRGG
jgi:NTE family protein